MLCRCVFTVLSEMNSSVAMEEMVCPRATRAITSISRCDKAYFLPMRSHRRAVLSS